MILEAIHISDSDSSVSEWNIPVPLAAMIRNGILAALFWDGTQL